MTITVAGQRWYATASTVELIVIMGGDAVLSCAGSPMALERQDSPTGADSDGEPILLAKRYEDAQSGIRVLITREGGGPLTADGRMLVPQATQPLPSSD